MLEALDWSTLASIATAIGVLVFQIFESRQIAQTTFEDSLDQQYRSIAMDIPVDVLIGKPLGEDNHRQVRELIYNYLDLCNEQVYLRSEARVRLKTWRSWCSGISAHLSKPAFAAVWDEVRKEAPESFTYLLELYRNEFDIDPRGWPFSHNDEPEEDEDDVPVLESDDVSQDDRVTNQQRT